jgi:hypothetical protein
MITEQVEQEDDETFMRSLTWCEEDRRRLHPGVAWNGGYRWFRSPNVIPLERYRPFKRVDR